MRRKKTGQPLDHIFKKLNRATSVSELEQLKELAKAFKPRSDYEIKDKKNLLEQIDGAMYFYN